MPSKNAKTARNLSRLQVIPYVLPTALAQGGAIVLPYPKNKSRGDFLGSTGHAITAGQSVFEFPNDFEITFAGAITITWRNPRSIPAGSTVLVELREISKGIIRDELTGNATGVVGAQGGGLYMLNLGSPVASDDDGLCAAQSITGPGEQIRALLNGALTVAATAELDVPRSLQIVSSSSLDVSQVVTVRGLDVYGEKMIEARQLNGIAPVKFAKAFKTIADVYVSDPMAGQLKVGTSDTLGLPTVLPFAGYVQAELVDGNDAASAGLLVTASQVSASATTGDVRGTYTPALAPNGSRTYRLFAFLTDPGDIGGSQFGADADFEAVPGETPGGGSNVPPEAVTGLAELTPTTTSSITWQWSAVAGATEYQVRTRQLPGGSFSAPVILGVTERSITGLTPDTSYEIEVIARNAYGDSPAVTDQATTAPNVVSGYTLTRTAGEQQGATAGIALAAFEVELKNSGTPVVGETINWTIVSGGGSLSSATSVTNGSGKATVVYTPPTGAGIAPNAEMVIRAQRALNTALDTNFTVTGMYNPAYNPAPLGTNDARRFLDQATFGPTPGQAAAWGTNFGTWMDAQKLISPTLLNVDAGDGGQIDSPNETTSNYLYDCLVGTDQLRLRMAHAIQQIVVAGPTLNQPRVVWYDTWHNQLRTHALGNFRSILDRSFRHILMGNWLNNANNLGRSGGVDIIPNQNYARELLQLFSLGIHKLNDDGTYQLDANGKRIPAYTQADVNALCRILSGWGYDQFFDTTVRDTGGDLEPYPAQHNRETVTFLGTSFPGFGANPTTTQMNDRANAAIDLIFAQPTCAVYISKQLIQKLVTDNPSPAYVSRVTAAFKNNGSGVRGDLFAVARAILLDPEARGNSKGVDFGRAQEWFLQLTKTYRLAQWNTTEWAYEGYALSEVAWQPIGGVSRCLLFYEGQRPAAPRSVFNDYPFQFEIEQGFEAPAFPMFRTNALQANFGLTIERSELYASGGHGVNWGTWLLNGLSTAFTNNSAFVDLVFAEFCQGRTPSTTTKTQLVAILDDLDTAGKTAKQKAAYLINVLRQLPEGMEVV